MKFVHSPEERNRILKKILAHFNVKVQNMETKSFMKIFGLEIKSINAQNPMNMSNFDMQRQKNLSQQIKKRSKPDKGVNYRQRNEISNGE